MRQASSTVYGYSLYEDAPDSEDIGDSHDSHPVLVDESRQPARPVADQSARSLASARRRSPVRAARARNRSPARNASATRTPSRTRDASPVRHAAHARDPPGPLPLQVGRNKRRAQEQAEGHRSKRHLATDQHTQLYKANHWREQDGLETKATPSWFPVATRWPAVPPAVDESPARMDQLCTDAHAPVRFVKSKLRSRTPRPLLFINKKDDQVVFGTWIIIRPFVLKMLVSRSVVAMPGLQREQWRSLVKLTLATAVARSLYAVLGLDGFVAAGAEQPAEEVHDRTVRGSDLIDQEPVDESLVAIARAPAPSSDAMDTDPSPAQPSLDEPQQSLPPTSASGGLVDRMFGSGGAYMHILPQSAPVARRPAFHELYEDPGTLPCGDDDSGDYDSDTSISRNRSKRSVAYGVQEIVPYLTEKLIRGEAPLRGEEERYQAEPGDWHDARTHLRYFYEAESSVLHEFDKSHHEYEKITQSLQCWFDYENRRILYLTSNLRLETNTEVIPAGEQLLMVDKFTFVNMQGRELPDTFASRRIWPYRATPAEHPAVDISPGVGQPAETATGGATTLAPSTPCLPWVNDDHGLELARLVVRLSASTKTFDEHPLKPWDDPNWLTDDLRAYIVWELREIEFRNGLYTVDFLIRAAHPLLDLAKIDPAQRTAQLHACWGGGDMKPNAASPSPYSLPETSPELLHALTAMLDFMAAWPRANQYLRRPATPWNLEQVDELASMVFGFYAQTYFDYIRCSAPLPVLRPPIPW